MPSSLKLSQEKRILFYIEQFSKYRDAWEVPFEASQEGISSSLGILVNNVSRTLAFLNRDSLIEEKLAHIHGVNRRRTVYFLSEKGRTLLVELKETIGNEKIIYTDIKGEKVEKTIAEIRAFIEKEHGIACQFFELIEFLREREFFTLSESIESIKLNKAVRRKVISNTERAPAIRQFFGRVHEMAEMRKCIDSDTYPVIIIQGMAGIGKSTLTAKLMEYYKPSKNILWFRLHEWDSTGSVLAEIAEFLSSMGRTRTSNYLKKNRLPEMNAVVSLLAMDLDGSNAILIFDDLQKPGEQLMPVLSLIVEISEHLKTAHFLLLTREKVLFYNRRDSIIKGKIKEISLSGLDEESSRKLLTIPIDEKQARDIWDLTKGHPLFLELINITGATGGRKDIDAFVNEEIYSKLSEKERMALGILSIFRYPVTIDAIASPTLGFDEISAMAKKSLVREMADHRFELHDVLREFAYNRLSAQIKEEYHRKAAMYYMDKEEHVEIADISAIYHLQKAGMWREAAAIAIEKCPSLIELNYQELSEILCSFKPQDLPKEQWADLLFLKAEFHMFNEEWYLALNNYLECLSIGESIGSEPKLLASIHTAIAEVQGKIENWEETKNSQERALKLLEKSGDKLGMAKTCIGLGMAHRQNRDRETARKYYDRALQILEELGEKRGMAAVYNNIGYIYSDGGDWARAIESIEKALKLSIASADLSGQAIACRNLGEVHSIRGNWKDAFGRLEESFDIFRKAGDQRNAWEVAEKIGDIHLEIGDLQDALEWFEHGADIIRGIQTHRGGLFFGRKEKNTGATHQESRALSRILSKLATGHRNDGSFDKCRVCRVETIAILLKTGDSTTLAKEYLESALDMEASGRMNDGITIMLKAREILKNKGTKKGETAVTFNLGRLYENKGDIEKASGMYKEALAAAEAADDWLGAANCAERFASIIRKRDEKKSRDLWRKAAIYYRYAGLPRESKRAEREWKG